jgi:nicotinate-nucleotide--dimethylbenzimidazole phosphoribosyltransferase
MAGGKVLILGGIRSGKSDFAESLFEDAQRVRYVATAGHDDESFAERIAAHRFRRPASWETVEAVGDPARLIDAVSQAGPDDELLVDDLGGWATSLLGTQDAKFQITQLAEAVRLSPARIVLVSPEVGLSVVPPSQAGVEFADLMGDLNKAVAAACDEVTLVVAGQRTVLKQAAAKPLITAPAPTIWAAPATAAATATAAGMATGAVATPATPAPTILVSEAAAHTPAAPALVEQVLTESTRALPIVETRLTIRPGMDLPIHDDDARSGAEAHLSTLDIPGSGLGELAKVVIFAAGTQSRSVPQPWRKPQLLLLNGGREGDSAAGDSFTISAAIAQTTREGGGPIGLLAARENVAVKVVDIPVAEDMAYGRAADPEVISSMLTQGWQLADDAADHGCDLIMLASCSPGAAAAAAAIVARLTGAEIAALLGRIVGPDGSVDDPSWILRAAAVRDALHRSRNKDLSADTVLSELGGPDVAVAAGVILGATARRTPVMIDGPLAAAAALLARDLGSQSRLWVTIPDFSADPVTKNVADILGTDAFFSLKTGLGEGTAALLALPVLNEALMLSASLPVKPPILKAPPEFEGSMPLVD